MSSYTTTTTGTLPTIVEGGTGSVPAGEKITVEYGVQGFPFGFVRIVRADDPWTVARYASVSDTVRHTVAVTTS